MGYGASVRFLAARPQRVNILLMSAAALTTVMISLLIEGAARQADEGLAAHIFQILIAGEFPVVAFFALRTTRNHAFTLTILAAQVGAVAAAMGPVLYLNL